MNKTLAIFAIALIAVIMVVGTVSPTVFADKPDKEDKKEKSNNGNKGCENANPNSKACEKNPNTTICQYCNAKLIEAYAACEDGNDQCLRDAFYEYLACIEQVPDDEETCPPTVPPGRG